MNVAFVNIDFGKLNTPLKPLVTYCKNESVDQGLKETNE